MNHMTIELNYGYDVKGMIILLLGVSVFSCCLGVICHLHKNESRGSVFLHFPLPWFFLYRP